MTALHVRISVRGQLTDALREELAGFVEGPTEGGRLLWGTVPDMASLLGVLQRLHLAGVVVEDVERLLEPESPGGRSGTARIQVEGRVADFVSGEFGLGSAIEATTTTIEIRVADQNAFFAVLTRLEALALEVREAHVRPGLSAEDA